MKRNPFLLVCLSVAMTFLHHVTAQETANQVLVAIGTGEAHGLHHINAVYAIDAAIVDKTFSIESPLTARTFVYYTTKIDCCAPRVKVGSKCWHCCDGKYICTNDTTYDALVDRTNGVSEDQWRAALDSKFRGVPGWPEIESALLKNPPIAVSLDDPRVRRFMNETDK